MKSEKDLSIINCIATAMLAYFFTVPVHELFHLLTYYAYGDKGQWFSAGAVQNMGLVDYQSLPIFHRVMATGGSASILNAIIGILLCIILLKTRMGAMTRLFLTQLMGGHLSVGIDTDSYRYICIRARYTVELIMEAVLQNKHGKRPNPQNR